MSGPQVRQSLNDFVLETTVHISVSQSCRIRGTLRAVDPTCHSRGPTWSATYGFKVRTLQNVDYGLTLLSMQRLWF